MSTDSTETPRLSPSIAHVLLEESPKSAWAKHRLLGGIETPPTPAQIEGRLWHAAILEQWHEIVPIEADSYRTKAAKEAKEEALANGQTPVLETKFAELETGAARIRCRMQDLAGIELVGTSEARVEWDEDILGHSVPCSGFIDHWFHGESDRSAMVVELKTGTKAFSRHACESQIAGGHGLLQYPAYTSALQSVHGFASVGFIYVFAQTVQPYCVTPIELSGEFAECAYLRWLRACRIWHQCLTRGTDEEHWPGPAETVLTAQAPGWMLAKELEMEAYGKA